MAKQPEKEAGGSQTGGQTATKSGKNGTPSHPGSHAVLDVACHRFGDAGVAAAQRCGAGGLDDTAPATSSPLPSPGLTDCRSNGSIQAPGSPGAVLTRTG